MSTIEMPGPSAEQLTLPIDAETVALYKENVAELQSPAFDIAYNDLVSTQEIIEVDEVQVIASGLMNAMLERPADPVLDSMQPLDPAYEYGYRYSGILAEADLTYIADNVTYLVGSMRAPGETSQGTLKQSCVAYSTAIGDLEMRHNDELIISGLTQRCDDNSLEAVQFDELENPLIWVGKIHDQPFYLRRFEGPILFASGDDITDHNVADTVVYSLSIP